MIDLDALGLGAECLVLLDSAPLIYLVEGGTAARASVLRAFLEAAERGRIRLVASTMLWAEVLTRPRAVAEPDLAAAYRRLLSDSASIVLAPVDVAVAEEAARLLGGDGHLELADALHLATASVLGVGAILTNDEAWKAKARGIQKDPGKPRVLLVDELAWT